MSLNDELYSRLVNLYRGLEDQKIHEINARIILLLSEQLPNKLALERVIDKLESELVRKLD